MTATHMQARESDVRIGAVLTAVVAAATAVVMLNVSLNPALASLAVEVGASQADLQWIVDVYPLCLAALLLPAGALGDRFGRRRAMLVGLVILGVANAVAVLADGAQLVIACRAIAGVGAALLFPGTLSTITSTFPPEQRAQGVGIWSASAGLAGILGLLISGALVEVFWFGSVFVFGAVTAAVVWVLVWRFVPESSEPDNANLDVPGVLLSALAVGGVVLGIVEGPVKGWASSVVLAGLGVGIAAGIAFVLWELRVHKPLLDVRLFANRGMSTGSVCLFAQSIGGFGLFFVAFFYLTHVLGYGPLMSGVALLPLMIGTPLGVIAIPLSRRFGRGPVMGGGLLLGAVGPALCLFINTDTTYWLFAVAIAIVGMSLVLSGPPGTESIVESLPPAKQGVASAINDVLRELAAAISIAGVGSAFNAAYRSSINDGLAGLPSEVRDTVRESPAAFSAVAASLGDAGRLVEEVGRQAVVDGMTRAMALVCAVLVAGGIYALVFSPRRAGQQAPDEETGQLTPAEATAAR